jgi:hypothetical protein
MELLELPGWRLEYDRLATIAACKLALAYGPEQCDCNPCRNWVATRDQLFPIGFRDLLNQLGISHDCEAEVYHNCRLESGLHSYGAWYHFIGRVIYGERECSPFIVFGSFSVYFHSKPALMPESFAGQPVVQLEVVTEVPWLSDVPEAS